MNMMIHLNSSDLITISYYIYNKHKSTLHRNQTTDPELLAKHWFAGHQKALDRQNIGCQDTKRHSTGKTLVPGTPKGTRPAKHWFPGHQKALDRQNIGSLDTKRHSTGKTLVAGTPKGTRPLL